MNKYIKLTCYIICLLFTKQFVYGQTISSFTPASGPVGTVVTITGTGLTSTTAASVNGTSAVIVSAEATKAVIMVMPGTTSGAVSLTSGSTVTNGNFTVGAPTAISATGTQMTVSIGNQFGSSIAVSADG